MEDQSSASHLQYQYQWQRLIRRNTLADPAPTSSPSSLRGSPQLHTQLDLLPILLPQQESYHQAQLAHYNKLLVSSTGVSNSARTSAGLQALPLPPLLSAQHIQAVPRSRSSSRAGSSAKSHKSLRGGHGNKDARKSSKGERALVAEREKSAGMEKLDLSGKLPNRPLAHHQNPSQAHQSSSVPSTPHQHARKFSFDREPSPTTTTNHSPRSAYSESNIVLPTRTAPPPRGGCRYETAMNKFKRRMPYNIGSDKLETLDSAKIKSELSRDEERKLTTDMRELYDRLLPTPESETRREKLVQKLETLFNNEWPGHNIRVHVFGSSGNLLCTDESDVDICITTAWKELEGVCMIAGLLAKSGMEKVICVPTAKVPIVKMWDPKLDLACDMNVNNTLALENTRMIKTYIQIDPRVRPLAMIIKHWTKRRILNDAAFGGTLSSYTWICMIINFLQTRNPPVLPNLHQTPHSRLVREDGLESIFADDLDALRGFGELNKETLGELFFGFFRFYAHEFDYDNLVVSVRHGTHIFKADKMWHLATNNRLCVEEPFNLVRNLGNTVDDTSFRGLHMELRRAFDLLSNVKLEECCEEYIYPEIHVSEHIFEKPAPTKKPVLRSASQSSRGGRGNQRGGRHNNSNGRNASGSRRASSGHFDNPAAAFIQGVVPPTMAQQEVWLQRQAQAQLHNDLFATYSVLQAQENNLRLQLYNQSQQYLQVQNQAFPQGSGQGSSPGNKQQGDRNRTSSFDQPPLSAPIRPDMYFYPLQYQPGPVYGYQTPSTNPSSPSLSNAVPELRRSVHRSSVTNGSGNGQSAGSLRSHSQPASRSNQSQLSMQAAGVLNPGIGIYQTMRQPSGVPTPNFVADENLDPSADPASARTASSSPDDTTPKEYVGYYVNEAALANSYRQSLMPMAIPAFGDIKQSRRRPSMDQLPQSILDRLKRPSRSPSPLGHDRSHSINVHPIPPTSLPIRQSVSSTDLQALNIQAPLIVNGSNTAAPISIPHWQASMCNSSVSEDQGIETGPTSFESSSHLSLGGSDVVGEPGFSGQGTPREARTEVRADPPLVVNGSNPSTKDSCARIDSASPESTLPTQAGHQNGLVPTEQANGATPLRSSPNARNRLARQLQNGGVSPLDIGLSHSDILTEDLPHLSPVYETRTPSPTTNRKFEPASERKLNGSSTKATDGSPTLPQTTTKPAASGNQSKQSVTPAKSNGHLRGSKSEGGNSNAWQKAGSKKKKGISGDSSSGNGQPLSEKPPRKDSERRGG